MDDPDMIYMGAGVAVGLTWALCHISGWDFIDKLTFLIYFIGEGALPCAIAGYAVGVFIRSYRK
jgi:hypothetical protein